MSEPTRPAARVAVDWSKPCDNCGDRRDRHTLDGGPCLVRYADPLTEDDLCQCDEFEAGTFVRDEDHDEVQTWNRWAPDALSSPLAPAHLVDAYNRWQPDHLKIHREQS